MSQPMAPLCTGLLSALSKLLPTSRCKELTKYVEIVQELLHAEVCPRCVLRIFRHMKWEDYVPEPPDAAELLERLRSAMAAAGQCTASKEAEARSSQPTAHQHSAPAASEAVCDTTADAAMLDQPSSRAEAAEGADGPAAQSEAACGSAAPAARPASAQDGGGSRDRGGSAAAAAAADAACPRQTAVCCLCLGLLQRLRLQGQQLEADSAAPMPSTSDAGPYSPVALSTLDPETLVQILQRPGVEFASFSLDLTSLPLSVLLRERVLVEHMSSKYGWMGLFKHNNDQLIPLKMVLRRVLGAGMVQQLGPEKKMLDGGTDLSLLLTLDHPDGKGELRPLIEDHVLFQKKKEDRSRPQKQQRQQHKKQRQEPATAEPMETEAAAPGVKEEAADGAKAGRGVEEMGCSGLGTAALQVDDTAAATDALLASISYEKALGQVQSVPPHVIKRLFPWPLTPVGQQSHCTLSVKLVRASVFLAGRYLKLQRGMPQSRWFDPQTGQRIGCVSVAERIEEAVLPLYAAEESKFIAGGREDADVRMLGEGRPFVLELIHPQHINPSSEDLRRVEQALAAADHGARAIQLTTCMRKAMDKIKEAEESKEKTYLALCWAERPLTSEDVTRLLALQDLEIKQDTPLRVLHRRAPLVRGKKLSVEAVDVLPEKPAYFNIKLRTQAGTYVKEFCHGDLGRTQPNLGTLLDCRTEILQLDVAAIHMPDWP